MYSVLQKAKKANLDVRLETAFLYWPAKNC